MGYYTKNGGLIGFGGISEKRGVYDLIASQVIGDALYSFTSFTFTSAGQSGYQGPTLAQCQSAYSGAVFLASYFSVSGGIQQWTVPETGTYEIELRGGSGGGNTTGTYNPTDPGQGALIITRVNLSKGTVCNIVVGQTPTGAVSRNGSAGGGGTWIYTGSIGGSGLIAVAGGGGGWGHGRNSSNGGNGLGGNNNANGDSRRVAVNTIVNGRTGNGTGSTNGIGYGGGLSTTGSFGGSAGGAGWLSDGTDRQVAELATGGHSVGSPNWQGGTSADTTALYGGFGGGGGSNGRGEAGGGGGGYTGGPASNDWSGNYWGNAGGGGSYWTGTLVSATAGSDGGTGGHLRANATNGYAKITKV